MHQPVLIAFILSTLEAICKERLTHKQKHVLLFLLEREQHPLNEKQFTLLCANQCVPLLVKRLDCVSSSVWNAFRSLQRSKLISYGNSNKKMFLSLTELGRIVGQALQERGKLV